MKKQFFALLLTIISTTVKPVQSETVQHQHSLLPAFGLIVGITSALHRKVLPKKIVYGNTFVNKPDFHGLDPQRDFTKAAFYKAIDGYFAGHILDYLHTCAKQQLVQNKTTK